MAGASLLLGALLAVAASPPPVEEGWFLSSDGTRIFYKKVGSGPPTTVFVHGGPGSNFRGAEHTIARLADGRAIVFYDQRGSGLSELVADPSRLTAEHHVRDLEALRARFRLRRMALIGLSWGSGLAALYTKAHPARVERLLLLSPMAPSKALMTARLEKMETLRVAAELPARSETAARLPGASGFEVVELCREMTGHVFRFYFADPTPQKLAEAAERCDIPPAAIRNRGVVETATLASLGDWDFRPMLARIGVPTLVVEGARSNVPLDATRVWAEEMPAARLLLIPDAGHEAFADQPAAFLAAAKRFLEGRFPAEAELVGESDAH
jgi:proline iminopeptidase